MNLRKQKLLFRIWMKIILLKSYLETTIVIFFLYFGCFIFFCQNFIANLVLLVKTHYRLQMGQQNVYVCKIKKNKPFAPPSETYFLLCFETKKNVSKN